MEFYVASRGGIDPADIEMFERIALVVRELPDVIFDPRERGWDGCKNQFSCHLICRALAAHFDVSVRDGYFLKGYEHSWLVPTSGSGSIIDAYPVAGAVPFIVSTQGFSPWPELYVQSYKLRHRFCEPEFLARLDKTTQMVGETLRHLNSGRSC